MVALLEDSLNKPEREKTVAVLNGGVFSYDPIVGCYIGDDAGDDYFYIQEAQISSINGSVFFEDQKWPWSYRDEVVDGTASTATYDRYLSLLWNHVNPGF